MSKILIETFNKKAARYDQLHSKYGTPKWYIEKQRKECTLAMINKKGKLLDVACGTGTYLLELSKYNDCFGIDISENMIRQCRGKNINNVFIGNYENLPFKDNIFDTIICINAIQYTEDPVKVLNEMNRVLKNGEIIVSFLNSLCPRNLIRIIRNLFRKKVIIERRYSPLIFFKKCAKAELKVIDICGFNFLPYKSDSERRNIVVMRICERFEKKIRKTPIKYFGNELIIKLIKHKEQN